MGSTVDAMNSELTKKALEIVGNPSTLVNLMSRRVRQLTSGGGGLCRPLVEPPVGAGIADIALLEIIEGKITFESTQEESSEAAGVVVGKPAPKRRRKTVAA
jgi:DNA-directed RNA polymerase subunit omega